MILKHAQSKNSGLRTKNVMRSLNGCLLSISGPLKWKYLADANQTPGPGYFVPKNSLVGTPAKARLCGFQEFVRIMGRVLGMPLILTQLVPGRQYSRKSIMNGFPPD